MVRPRSLLTAVVVVVALVPAGAIGADPIDAAGVIEGYDHDPFPTSGRASDVCVGGPRPGAVRTLELITETFAWARSGGLYQCRTSSTCGFVAVDPRAQPGFTSECWSSHASGRAIDVMVGGATPDPTAASHGDALVDWLLATDAAGRPHARARRLGVQTIVWDDGCWTSERDLGVGSADALRRCDRGHHDHVHLDLTVEGAAATTSGFGPLAPPPTTAPEPTVPPTPTPTTVPSTSGPVPTTTPTSTLVTPTTGPATTMPTTTGPATTTGPSATATAATTTTVGPTTQRVPAAGGWEVVRAARDDGFGPGSLLLSGWRGEQGRVDVVVTAADGRRTIHRYRLAADGTFLGIIADLAIGATTLEMRALDGGVVATTTVDVR